jgi:hypothetical protein
MLHFLFPLTFHYLILTTLTCLGTLQCVAVIAGRRGLLLLRPPWLAALVGAATAIGALWWFFASGDRNTPGLAGWEQSLLFLAGAVIAMLVTVVLSSLFWRSASPRSPAGEGLEALRDRSYWQAIAPRILPRQWEPGT